MSETQSRGKTGQLRTTASALHRGAPGDAPPPPVDVEWMLDGDRVHLLQIRPFRTTGHKETAR